MQRNNPPMTFVKEGYPDETVLEMDSKIVTLHSNLDSGSCKHCHRQSELIQLGTEMFTDHRLFIRTVNLVNYLKLTETARHKRINKPLTVGSV